MTCLPSQLAARSEASDRERIRARAESLVRDAAGGHGGSPIAAWFPGAQSTAGGPLDGASHDAALATCLMDLFRRTGDRDTFDCLVQWVTPQLFARIRSRCRSLGTMLDPHEVLQDTIVNVYRYPDRFLASRPGAFAAWSSTIVDNAIRRHLRRLRQGVTMAFSAPEMLQEQADLSQKEPSVEAEDQEEWRSTASAFALLLQCYLAAFATLSERERFVLQMVEVRQMRYAELAVLIGVRPEALKMVVFRARKRVMDRMAPLLEPAAACVAPAPAPVAATRACA